MITNFRQHTKSSIIKSEATKDLFKEDLNYKRYYTYKRPDPTKDLNYKRPNPSKGINYIIENTLSYKRHELQI